MRWRRITFAFVVTTLASAPLRGQNDSCLHRTVPVNVLTAKGETVAGLTPENFKASFHRKAVRIVSVTQDETPRRVVIVLGASRSVISQKHDWQTYVRVAQDLTQVLPAGSSVGFVVFTKKIERNIPLTSDRAKIQDELVRLQTGAKEFKGRTSLRDAVFAVASTEFGTSQVGDTIYAITDGIDSSSATSLDDLRTILLEKRIRLFAFSRQVIPEDSLIEGGTSPRDLRELVESSGGEAINMSPNALGNVPDLADNLGEPTLEGLLVLRQFREIFVFNRVEIELPERFEKAQRWSWDTTGLDSHDVLLTYPRSLAGCASASPATVTKR
jgi:VWA domain-containing protein